MHWLFWTRSIMSYEPSYDVGSEQQFLSRSHSAATRTHQSAYRRDSTRCHRLPRSGELWCYAAGYSSSTWKKGDTNCVASVDNWLVNFETGPATQHGESCRGMVVWGSRNSEIKIVSGDRFDRFASWSGGRNLRRWQGCLWRVNKER